MKNTIVETRLARTLRVLIHREWDGEREKWAAQCLEHDIATQGKTLDDVKDRFARIVAGYIRLGVKHSRNPFGHLRPAPRSYHRMWKNATALRDSLPLRSERSRLTVRASRARFSEAEVRLAA